MKILYPFVAVLGLILFAFIGVNIGLESLFGVVFPYLAFLIFLVAFINRVMNWAKSPVPFRIPTTCGQANSLPWIKQAQFDNPSTTFGVVVRMFLEIVLFRSLFRNTKADIYEGPKLRYWSSKYLWLFGILFHYSFFTVVVRHLRLFTEPVPFFVSFIEFFDGFLQIGAPHILVSGLVLAGAVALLFFRRLANPMVRYISLPADYFPLFLIFAIAVTGILMRYFLRVDIVTIKQLTYGLATFSPKFTGEIGSIFYIHLFLVCALLVYFPLSKLMHMGGVFLSPTRNMANNSRMVRHINPWNDPSIKPHSYASYEDDFREFMVDAGLPVEKELPAEEPAAEEGQADEKETPAE